MPPENPLYAFEKNGMSFTVKDTGCLWALYFPLCGTDAASVKSSITPFLSGDIKTDSRHYLTKPVSTEDLRRLVRNFFCHIEGRGVVSLAQGASGDSLSVEAAPLRHKISRQCPDAGLRLEVVNFVPVTGQDVELMKVTVKNISTQTLTITPTFSVPIFGRALSNKHDHEHVTSLLHRIRQPPQGVVVKPTMIFDERGHEAGDAVYFVFGCDETGAAPIGSFPTTESFYGESVEGELPAAVVGNLQPGILPPEALDGKEAAGALRFSKIELAPGGSKEYVMVLGIASQENKADGIFRQFASPALFEEALKKNQEFWSEKASAIHFRTADAGLNSWMRWVSLQPVLRRIFGCSFLPDHDYGKGGRGWRDLWQDLLSLILLEPENVRQPLIGNFAGVRIDGSNATIIGAAPGEFLADRNAITRVWMDHGAWPFLTLLLYIHQTGDYDILLKPAAYFRDPQLSRGMEYDRAWKPSDGNCLKDQQGRIYRGTVLEHLLIQHLVSFFNVGEHNITRLEDADWNDGLDMAKERGEGVAFMSLYGGSLLELAGLLEDLGALKGMKEISLLLEIKILLDSLTAARIPYSSARQKRKLLHDRYFPAVQPCVSGKKVNFKIKDVAADLRRKGEWIFQHIRKNEWIKTGKEEWFNGYYDNQGERVEGKKRGIVRMTLTGQVFPIMSGLASDEQIKKILKSSRRYLKDKELGGYHLNTDFGLRTYMDLGRAFGFAYGTKENGAFFNHMAVMYAYALYKRGFARDGHEVLDSIYRMCADTGRSQIYPGIPEYFDLQGRGRYHYLTGSASWLVLTLLTQAFGVRAHNGDLVLAPQLVQEEFDAQGLAGVVCSFIGRKLTVTYVNEKRLDAGEYGIQRVLAGGRALDVERLSARQVKISRSFFEKLPSCSLTVVLG